MDYLDSYDELRAQNKSLLRQLAEHKKVSENEITELKRQLLAAKGEQLYFMALFVELLVISFMLTTDAHQESELTNRVQQALNECKQALQQQREENSRKTKLLNEIKVAKANEAKTVDLLKNENKQLEENIRR
jgi:gas vesicle protein